MIVSPWIWTGFTAGILGVLLLDLGVFHREAHEVGTREVAIWTAVWIFLALVFNGVVYWWLGPQAAVEFFTGYLIEKSLSIDNIFVFILVFSSFQVPPAYRHRVLFWGILGALVLRGALILVGAGLIARFEWILYIFGAFLVITGLRMAAAKKDAGDLSRNPLLRWIRRIIPLTDAYHGERFFVRRDGRLLATPLLVVLILVEGSDVMFAFDSIPAIFGITRDPFIVFTSNVFAILGLRSLYFLLGGIVERFRYLKYGLSLVLTFIGAKMLIDPWVEIPTMASLGVIAAILTVSILASVWWGSKEHNLP